MYLSEVVSFQLHFLGAFFGRKCHPTKGLNIPVSNNRHEQEVGSSGMSRIGPARAIFR